MGLINRAFYFLLLFNLILLLSANGLSAQLTQPFFHHYTTADGLPSSETYCVTQDRNGYLWFGTDNGVARFDGYAFKTYGIAEGLTDVVVFNVVEDSKGKLWFFTYSGRVFYLENGRFIPFRHSDQLIEIKHRIKFMNLIDVRQDGSLVFKLVRSRMLSISTDGKVTYVNDTNKVSGLIYYRDVPNEPFGRQNYVSSLNIYLLGQEKQDFRIDLWEGDGQFREIERIPGNELQFKEVNERPFFSPDYLAYRPTNDSSGEVLSIVDDQIYYRTASGERFRYRHGKSLSNHVIPHLNKGFWLAQGRGKGLLHVYLIDGEFVGKTIQIDRSLSGVSVNHLGYDREGGLWVCSQDRGLFYSPNPSLNTYVAQTSDNPAVPVALQLTGENHYQASYDSREIIDYDAGRGVTENINFELQKIRTIYDLQYDHENHVTYNTRGVYDNRSKQFIPFKKYIAKHVSSNIYIDYIKSAKTAKPNRYYVCDSNHGWYFDADPFFNSINLVVQDTFEQHTIKCFSQDYQDRFILGTLEGLFVQAPDGRFVANDFGIPALNTRIVSFENLLDGGILIATRGAGVVYISPRGNNTISEADGLVSNIVRGSHQSDNGDIWVNTLAGLSKLRLGPAGEIEEIRSFTTRHGLASNEIHYVDSYNNDVWLATGGGVIDFEEVPLNTMSKPPIITSLTVDADVISPDSLNFTQGQHDLKISFSTVNYQMLGKIPYRYRLDPNDEWECTNSRTVEYPNLAAGDYQFEVQSQNQDRIWSQSTVLPLSIPYQWYNRWYFYLLGVLSIVAFVAAVFKLREQQRIEEQKIKDQIDDLERAAVQAQMNPHFVFNSLNSIQYFILQNDTKQAVYYLSRFASLIRQTLKASVRGVHSLKEELGMLEIYLSLEKLRFKESFDYRIEVDPNLPVTGIKISPMLVQPFVENAILHGLADVDSGGLVTINFGGSAQELIVTVTDNGCGFDPKASITSDSMGSRITQRRLQKLGGNGSGPIQERIRIESGTGEDDRAKGTTVTLIIPSINQ